MKGSKIVYWISTVFLSLIMLFSAGMYLFNTAEVMGVFVHLGYPAHLVYPLAAAKILGVVAILAFKEGTLRTWSYAGFFYVAFLGTIAHAMLNESFLFTLLVLIAVVLSYVTRKSR